MCLACNSPKTCALSPDAGIHSCSWPDITVWPCFTISTLWPSQIRASCKGCAKYCLLYIQHTRTHSCNKVYSGATATKANCNTNYNFVKARLAAANSTAGMMQQKQYLCRESRPSCALFALPLFTAKIHIILISKAQQDKTRHSTTRHRCSTAGHSMPEEIDSSFSTGFCTSPDTEEAISHRSCSISPSQPCICWSDLE